MKNQSILIFLLIIVWSGICSADIFDIPKPAPVMKRKFTYGNQFVLNLGYYPMNSFSKYYSASIAYIHILSDISSWEVLNISGFSEIQSSLKKTLLDPSAPYRKLDGSLIQETDFPSLKFTVTTNYLYTPFYTKSLAFNSNTIYSQFSLLFGGGISKFSTESIPTISLGIIQKFFLSQNSSTNIDFRYFNYISNKVSIRGNFIINLGYAWTL